MGILGPLGLPVTVVSPKNESGSRPGQTEQEETGVASGKLLVLLSEELISCFFFLFIF